MTIRNYNSRAKQIVASARSYLGVPFHHQGRNRAGLDCLGLLVCVARDCGLRKDGKLIARHDETDYGHYPDAFRLTQGIANVLFCVDEVRLGDVVQFEHEGTARHLGIVGDYLEGHFSLIHAYAPTKKVVEHRLDEQWQSRIKYIWRFTE